MVLKIVAVEEESTIAVVAKATVPDMATAAWVESAAWRLFSAKQWILETIVGYEIVCRILQSIDRGSAGKRLRAGIFTCHDRCLSLRRCHGIELRLLGPCGGILRDTGRSK
jgi:hypothetical protein